MNRVVVPASQSLYLLPSLAESMPQRYCICRTGPPEPVFVNCLGSPGIDSQPGGPVRQPYGSYRPARLQMLAKSNPRNRFLGSIIVYKYGLWLNRLAESMPRIDSWLLKRFKYRLCTLMPVRNRFLFPQEAASSPAIIFLLKYLSLRTNKKNNKNSRRNHRDGRVLSVFSSRRNWDSPTPSPAGECAQSPFGLGGGGGGHTRLRERGWGSPTEEIHCGTLHTVYTYMYFVGVTPVVNGRRLYTRSQKSSIDARRLTVPASAQTKAIKAMVTGTLFSMASIKSHKTVEIKVFLHYCAW
jgi:hypothetical protein